ncbi:MAG TPA: glycosyltransferase family 2 protein [Candidatus Atribacteria bacterium]|nr:glycosyltransferase family 2 protein [Candidatus Atribacteria bacterium]
MKLSVIIPAYNEEKRLPRTLREIDEYLKKQDYDSEIIVVSDGSTDKTVEVVKNLMNYIENLKILDFKKNRGKGFGVRQGMLKAMGDYRLFTDADNSTSIDQVEKMWPFFEKGYDVVIGSRDVKGAVLSPPQPWWRRLLGDIFRFLTHIICGTWGILDTQCGFKGFTKKAAENIFKETKINGFAFDPEILVIAKKFGYKIKEIPVRWRNDPESKVKFKNMIKMGIGLFKIRLNLISHKYD